MVQNSVFTPKSRDDQEFLDSYIDNVSRVWGLYQRKQISANEREETLSQYRKRLAELMK